MSESISVINFPKSRGVPSDSDSASVRESPREIQPLESVEIFTACGQLNFASLHRRDRRDEFRVVVRVVCNTDVLAVLEPARDGRLLKSNFFYLDDVDDEVEADDVEADDVDVDDVDADEVEAGDTMDPTPEFPTDGAN
jgi:hypothetical protein